MSVSGSDQQIVKDVIAELVLANKILTKESVLDVYGHVSVRHPLAPDRFIMSQDCPPLLVRGEEMLEYGLDGEDIAQTGVSSYRERYIHSAIYAARDDVNAVCHNHALTVLPFCICTDVPLQIVSQTASMLGGTPPVWDVADEFGPATDVVVTSADRADSMAKTLGGGTAVLMRAHGSTVVGRDIRQMVLRSFELVRNAHILLDVLRLGAPIHGVNEQEIALNAKMAAGHLGGSYARQWRYFSSRAEQL